MEIIIGENKIDLTRLLKIQKKRHKKRQPTINKKNNMPATAVTTTSTRTLLQSQLAPTVTGQTEFCTQNYCNLSIETTVPFFTTPGIGTLNVFLDRWCGYVVFSY